MELDFTEQILAKRGLWENIRRKKERIKRGSNEKMRKVGDKGAPTKEQIERAKGKALTPAQKEKFMKLEKEVSMKDFLKKYGEKKGKSIYYATLMKMAQAQDFKPHMMYDPKTGKGYKAKVYEDHIKMKKMGYTHEKPAKKV